MTVKRRTEQVREWLLGLPRGAKRVITIGTDLLMLPLAVWLAFFLRLGEPFHPFFLVHWWVVLVVPPLGIACFVLSGLYSMVARYIGPQAIFDVFKAAVLTTLAFVALVELMRFAPFPRSAYPIFMGLVFMLHGGIRLLASTWFKSFLSKPRGREPVAIYGAGRAGVQLRSTLLDNSEFHARLFIDDDPKLHGQVITGLKVYAPEDLPRLIERCELRHVLLAIPSVSRGRRQEIVQSLEGYAVHVKTLPDMADLVSGRARVEQIQEIDVDDLLGRGHVDSDNALVREALDGRSVMITGAGGSIGSELARQAMTRELTRLVLFDHSEYLLYRIERELRQTAAIAGQAVEIIPLLGSATDQRRLQSAFRAYEVEVVYHAAAYKHVPLVETNPLEGIRNNALATRGVAEAAQAAGVKDMVLVSTDKAVHPHNVMGATKRLAELVLQSLAAERQGGTRHTIVRFGNVLNSSGSVVPLFREQIRHGGPVTVTHRDVTRYFMSIREAASLVIQAGALSNGGEVYVLDMGKPVKILDLAQRMVRLSGFTVRDEANPEGDVAIDFIGLRPGEKLHEALFYGADVCHTAHPMIMQTAEPSVPWKDLSAMLDELHRAVEGFDYARATRVLCRSIRGSGMDREAYDQLARRLEASLNEALQPQLNGPTVQPGEVPSRPH